MVIAVSATLIVGGWFTTLIARAQEWKGPKGLTGRILIFMVGALAIDLGASPLYDYSSFTEILAEVTLLKALFAIGVAGLVCAIELGWYHRPRARLVFLFPGLIAFCLWGVGLFLTIIINVVK